MVTPTSSRTEPAATPMADNDPRQSPRFRRLRLLSHLLDNAIVIPGTGYRFGLDPLLGLIPAAGDGLGFILSAVILWESAQFGTSPPTLFRMGLNIIIEALIGIIPLIGDLFDVVWKANAKNLQLLEQELRSPRSSRQTNLLFLLLLLAGLSLIVLGMFWISMWLIMTVLGLLSARLFGS